MTLSRILRAARNRLHWISSHLPKPLRKRLGKLYRKLVGAHADGPQTGLAEKTFLAGLETTPLAADTVIYESFYGKSMSCSSRAIFDALLDDPAYAHLHHVWALTSTANAPEALRDHPRISFVKPGSADYAAMLARAGTVVTNSTLPVWYLRRDGQAYVNTWHGVPLKRMFKYESAQQVTVHRNSQRNFLQASHIILQNAFTAQALLGSADVHEAVAGRVICSGAPRTDETLRTDRAALRAELGVAPDQKLVFFAPTWRGLLGKMDTSAPMQDALLAQLGALNPDEFAIFAQAHNFVGGAMKGVRGVPPGMSTNRFMAAVDVLVTDYSSIMFDFFPTGRQVILYAYDRAEYEELRGLNFDLEELPATICMRPAAVIEALKHPQPPQSLPQYAAARERFFAQEDGQATARAISAIFEQPQPLRQPQSRPRLVFFGGGWKNNGITTSMLNLLASLAPLEVDVYVVTEGASLEKSAELLGNLRKVDPRVHLIHRAGGLLGTEAEIAALNRFYAQNAFTDAAHAAQVKTLFQREARRLFGDLEFDAAVDFSGYARYWSLLIAATPARRHVIWQHNDLRSEADKRFEILNGVFAAYRWFDRIVSVSDETREVNRLGVGRHYPSADCAATVRNMIVPADIRARAARPMPAGLVLDHSRPIFVMAGRLSPEKAQGRAIRALGLLRRGDAANPGQEAGLVIMGSGPLEAELRAEAQAAGVEDLVVFAGHVSNPFPVVARGDCFLLSSDYEGQPMVLLEALTLGKPVVSTDIPGARSVLGADLGLLVPVSDEGVAHGMRQFIAGQVSVGDFDADRYCEAALADFFGQVLGQPVPPGASD